MSGIGHNRGPQLARSGRRKSLAGSLPIKAVRPPVRRARSLRLDRKTCAGIRARAGRDLLALLYASNALGVFRDEQAPAAQVLARRLGAVSVCPLAPFGARWATLRDEVKGWLRAQGLPGDTVLMIGETAHEREMMTAGGLAGFVSGQAFFAGVSDAL